MQPPQPAVGSQGPTTSRQAGCLAGGVAAGCVYCYFISEGTCSKEKLWKEGEGEAFKGVAGWLFRELIDQHLCPPISLQIWPWPGRKSINFMTSYLPGSLQAQGLTLAQPIYFRTSLQHRVPWVGLANSSTGSPGPPKDDRCDDQF